MFELDNRLKKSISLSGDNINVDNINENTNLIDDLGFSSINIVQLIVNIEDEFRIEIEDEYLNVESLSTYKGLVEILRSIKEK